METFPKWIHEFDSIPYMVIKDSDVQPKENYPCLEQDRAIIQWSKNYAIMNANLVVQCLKEIQTSSLRSGQQARSAPFLEKYAHNENIGNNFCGNAKKTKDLRNGCFHSACRFNCPPY